MADESLETFAPQPCVVQLRGRTVDVMPLRMRQLPAMQKAVAPVLELLFDGRADAIVESHLDDAVAVVAIGTGETREDLLELWPDDFLALVRAVWEVNANFFARRVLPAATEAATAMRAATAELVGAQSSPASSDGDTDSTTASS